MQNQTAETGNQNESVQPVVIVKSVNLAEVEHVYFEVGKELLSKPNTLCDLLDSEGQPATVVFCNSPSDADFVDVMLRKRGIGSQKLIGFVPKPRLDKALEDFNSGLLSVLVVTDIGARGIDLSRVEFVVNYSVPTDPDLYSQRAGVKAGDEEKEAGVTVVTPKVRKVVCLISPLDLANFHDIRKSHEVAFVQADLPTAEAVKAGKFLSLKRAAQGREFKAETLALAEQLLKDPEVKNITALLLVNTLDILPGLRASAIAKDEIRDDGGDDDDDYPQPRSNRGANDRGGRDSRNGGRDNRDGGGRYGRGRDDNRGGDDYGNGSRNNKRFEGGERGERQPRRFEGEEEQRGERGRRPQRQHAPVVKEARIYVGRGSAQNFSREALTGLLSESCQLGDDALKRFSARPQYSFFDIPEEHADKVIEALASLKAEKEKTFFAKKAITLTAAREESRGGDDDGEGQQPRHDGDDDRQPMDSQNDDQNEGDESQE